MAPQGEDPEMAVAELNLTYMDLHGTNSSRERRNSVLSLEARRYLSTGSGDFSDSSGSGYGGDNDGGGSGRSSSSGAATGGRREGSSKSAAGGGAAARIRREGRRKSLPNATGDAGT